jgi:hypothetical protein
MKMLVATWGWSSFKAETCRSGKNKYKIVQQIGAKNLRVCVCVRACIHTSAFDVFCVDLTTKSDYFPIAELICDYSAVRTETLNTIQINFLLYDVKRNHTVWITTRQWANYSFYAFICRFMFVSLFCVFCFLFCVFFVLVLFSVLFLLMYIDLPFYIYLQVY